MSITNTERDSPPPPLPPPRTVDGASDGQDPGWQFAHRYDNNEVQTDASASLIKPGSSLLSGNHMKQGKSYTGPERKVEFDRASHMEDSPASNPELKNDGSEQSQERIPDLQALLEYKYVCSLGRAIAPDHFFNS